VLWNHLPVGSRSLLAAKVEDEVRSFMTSEKRAIKLEDFIIIFGHHSLEITKSAEKRNVLKLIGEMKGMQNYMLVK
jgi:hypothetical protein